MVNTSAPRPRQFTHPEVDCACGVRYRLELETVLGPSNAPWYQHCAKDEGGFVPGKINAVWELRDGKWVRTDD